MIPRGRRLPWTTATSPSASVLESDPQADRQDNSVIWNYLITSRRVNRMAESTSCQRRALKKAPVI
jgi:hypothetical protein